MRTEKSGRSVLHPLFLFALAAILIIPGLPPTCPARIVFHVPCPTCGMTRAARLVMVGRFAEATHMHPLVWIFAVAALVFFAVEIAGYARTGAWGAGSRIPGLRVVGGLVLAALVAVWIARFMGAFGGPVPV